MVACAALSSFQPPDKLAVPMTSNAQSVEDLKKQLLFAAENDNVELCDFVLEELRKLITTREILEVTRVGFHLNNVRRTHLKKWPALSKKSREIIKAWQEFVQDERRTISSGASSTNGTPNVISPGIARLRRVTPNTPVNRRVTSTGLPNGRNGANSTISPANGSYAPRSQKVSPAALAQPAPITNGFHKSQSVGSELSHTAPSTTPIPGSAEDARNGKRKAEDTTVVNPIKRTKTTGGFLAAHAPLTPLSVSAARKDVQSTSELVAQLSQNLPDHMNIDSSIRKHEEKVRREQQDEELAHQLIYGPATTSSPYVQERKKRKYERKQKPVQQPSPISAGTEERRGGLILRIPRLATVREEAAPAPSSNYPTSAPVKKNVDPEPVEQHDDEDVATTSSSSSTVDKGKKINWMDMLPSLEELKIRSEKEKEKSAAMAAIAESTRRNPVKVRLIRGERRNVLMLPYLDNPSVPDFIFYKYRNGLQYYSEENFAYGAPRPTS
ncbi:unnamed protein product [Caenorhabditis auriculariae]|uniref:TFIIS N-terminal domain-containing protein n=1 Tax=Caenorhabditis auriculariae TaxID=2777116 RepID=A0A8S1HHD8_9PELO|nr:unnamed protein product [Caenorhabditis auriculariae]